MPPRKIKKSIVSTEASNHIVDFTLNSIADKIQDVEEGLKTLNEKIDIVSQKILTIDEDGDATTSDVDIDTMKPKKVISNLTSIIGEDELKNIIMKHLSP